MYTSNFKRLFYFLAFLALFFAIDRLVISQVDLVPYPYEMKEPLYQNIVYKKFIHSRLNYLEPQINKNLKILVLGTSRTLTGISPQTIAKELSLPPETLLNFSLPAESYRDIYTILNDHVEEIKAIPLLIIEISPFQFYYPYCPYIEEKGNLLEKASWSFTYHDFHMLTRSFFISYRKRDILRGYILRWCRLLGKLIKSNTLQEWESPANFLIKDFHPMGRGWVAAIGQLEEKWKGIDLIDRKLFPHPSNQEREWKNFLKIIRLAEREQLKVLFIEMPVQKEAEEKVLSEDPSLYTFFQEEVKPFLRSRGYTVLEAGKEFRFKESEFYDANHLNKKGAVKFSREMARWLAKEEWIVSSEQ
ncbi:MAG: hypothetical protein GXO71_00985 [Caldiserica bacterium]|nr:hypothetical protein [Caldisericota bacterium]